MKTHRMPPRTGLAFELPKRGNNCFMNVPTDGTTGALRVEAPISKAGDSIVFRAAEDVVIDLAACSALQSTTDLVSLSTIPSP